MLADNRHAEENDDDLRGVLSFGLRISRLVSSGTSERLFSTASENKCSSVLSATTLKTQGPDHLGNKNLPEEDTGLAYL